MSILPLVDLAISRLPSAPAQPNDSCAVEALSAWVARAVASAVQEVETLRCIDNDLRKRGGQAADRAAAELLRGAFEVWAEQATAILNRCDRIRRRGGSVPGNEELDDQHGRVMAMLQVSLDDLDEADAQLRRGEGRTTEEIRNELRAKARAQGPASTGGPRPMAPGGDDRRDRAVG